MWIESLKKSREMVERFVQAEEELYLNRNWLTIIEILLLVEKHQEKDKNIGLSPTACYQLLKERLGVNISKTIFQRCINTMEER